MDLNPREAVVDQEPPYTPEPAQGEEPAQALLIPQHLMEAVMADLDRLAADLGEPVCIVYGTKCITTKLKHHLDCGD
jgi:hypothetical protein